MATRVDELINKAVKQGYLKQDEAERLVGDVAEETRKAIQGIGGEIGATRIGLSAAANTLGTVDLGNIAGELSFYEEAMKKNLKAFGETSNQQREQAQSVLQRLEDYAERLRDAKPESAPSTAPRPNPMPTGKG